MSYLLDSFKNNTLINETGKVDRTRLASYDIKSCASIINLYKKFPKQIEQHLKCPYCKLKNNITISHSSTKDTDYIFFSCLCGYESEYKLTDNNIEEVAVFIEDRNKGKHLRVKDKWYGVSPRGHYCYKCSKTCCSHCRKKKEPIDIPCDYKDIFHKVLYLDKEELNPKKYGNEQALYIEERNRIISVLKEYYKNDTVINRLNRDRFFDELRLFRQSDLTKRQEKRKYYQSIGGINKKLKEYKIIYRIKAEDLAKDNWHVYNTRKD